MATRFFCENPDCENYKKLTIISSVVYRYKDGSYNPDNQHCSNCHEVMAYVDIDGPMPECNIGSFAMATPERKKEYLKKRTKALDKKNDIQGIKEHYKNKTLKRFFEG